MDIQKLLIVDASPVFADDLTQRLEGTFLIRSCTDGATARTLLRSFRPHVMVMDLMLPQMDGLEVLRSISPEPDRPRILVTTTVMTQFIEQSLQSIEFDYIMRKPCNCGILSDRICELSHSNCRDIFMPVSGKFCVDRMLNSLNVSSSSRGHDFLPRAVELFSQTPHISMTGQLYPALGRQFDVQPGTVERDIRLAIHAAWSCRNDNIWRQYFGCDSSGNVPRPTNTQFIRTLAERMTMRNVR